MSQFLFLVVWGIVALSLQSSVLLLLIPSALRPDLTITVIAWSSGHIKFSVGIIFSFLLGLCVDLMSGAPLGLSGLLYMVIYVFFGYLDSYLEATGVARNYVAIFFASVIVFSSMIVARTLAAEGNPGMYEIYWVLVKSFSTATFSWLALEALNLVWKEYSKITGAI